MKIFYCVVFILLCYCPFIGQELRGVILDAESNKPVEAAHVFISGSSQGTFTEPDGAFHIEQIPNGFFELVITHIGYQSFFQQMNSQAMNDKLEITIKPSVVLLQGVEVVAKGSRKRKRQLTTFTQAFLGNTRNAKSTRILNPGVLRFEEKDNKLLCSAVDLLKIENLALGYEITFLLTQFEAEGVNVSYAGKPVFQEKMPLNDKEKEEWEKNRQIAYEGSIYHFLNCLTNVQARNAGYSISHAIYSSDGRFDILGPVDEKALVIKGVKGNVLNIPKSLSIVYTREKDPDARGGSIGSVAGLLGHRAEKDLIDQEKRGVSNNYGHQISFLFPQKTQIPIDNNGRLQRPGLLHEYGFWSTERLAEMVPLEYGSAYMKSLKSTKK